MIGLFSPLAVCCGFSIFTTRYFMKWILNIVFIHLLCAVATAQHEAPAHKVYHKNEFILKFDNRQTHINGDFISIYGLIAGISIHHTIRIKTGINATLFHAGSAGNGKNQNNVSRLQFYTLGSEFDVADVGKVTGIIYLQTGLGRHYHQVYDMNENKISDQSELILPLEAGLYGSYHVLPWIDLKIGGGWRWVLLNSQDRLSNYFLKLGIGLHAKKYRYTRQRKKSSY